MPFEGPEGQEFEDFEDCVDTVIEWEGVENEDQAKRMCGSWQDEAEGNYIIRINATDPTETTTKRDAFQRNYRSRWADVRGNNRAWIQNLSHRGLDQSGIQSRYRQYFGTMARNVVLSPMMDRSVQRGEHWTATHVRLAYQKGLELAERDLRNVQFPAELIQEATRYTAQEHKKHLQHEYEKVYFTTEDNVRWATTQVYDSLQHALENNKSRSWLIEETNALIRGKIQNRFSAQANTAIVRAVNEALLTSFELASVEQVGFAVEESAGSLPVRDNHVGIRVNAAGEVEWVTAGDDRVCPDCAGIDGQVMQISDIRDSPQFQPPLHPNCRCRLYPMPMEIKTTGETVDVPSSFSF